jgi:hypothetical protein
MIIPAFFDKKGINGYSPDNFEAKEIFHEKGPGLLKALAKEIGLLDFDVRSNKGGNAVSGEVTLHADEIYLQLFESSVGPKGLRLLYRTCQGRSDCSGGKNNEIFVSQLRDEDQFRNFTSTCRHMLTSLA